MPTGAGLAMAEGSSEVVVRADEVDVPLIAGMSVVDELQAEAREAQEPIVDYVEETDGLEVKNRFWLANAILLEVDTGQVDLESLAAQEGVAEVHPNFEFEIPDDDVTAGAETDGEFTYGLEQIGAPEAWDTYDNRGEGASIAVLDTGVDPAHPDIEIADENWAEFDGDGDEIDSEPNDPHLHGTHVSGTVVGGDDSGTAIGVAPDAELLHGKVLDDGGGGTFAQILGGMEWAVVEEADAMNLSLGVTGYVGEMIEPVRNAERAGTLVISSSGNDGVGTSGSPANVYDSVAIGATDEDEEVANFSSGETIDTDAAWGRLAPDEWPEEYVVPDVSAPGVDVVSAFPLDHDDGPYEAISGTSMAAPHVAGLVGLIEGVAVESPTNEQIKAALSSTARNPDGETDTRYGDGIVDAVAAIGRVAAESGVTGTVTDTDGDPIADATVDLDGFPTETDDDGEYTLRAGPGTYEVTAEAFGYATETTTVEVDDEFVTHEFVLGDALAVSITDDQPDGLEAGNTLSLELHAANLETLTVEQVGDYEGEAALLVDGEEAAFGESVAFDSPVTGTVEVEVETGEDGTGDLELEHTLTGAGEETTVTTGPTSVFDSPVPIGIIDDQGAYGADLEALLGEALPPRYQFEILEATEAIDAAGDGDHEAYVAQNLGDEAADFAAVASDPAVGVVYLDQFESASNAISQLSAATGDPAETVDMIVENQAPDVEYAVGQSHPILEGVIEEGESAPITQPEPVDLGMGMFAGGFHTFFEEYTGQVAGVTLAETAVLFTETGDGLAVDDLTRTVLAASLGVGTFVDRDDVTATGRQILANAVEHVVEAPPIEVLEAPAERIEPGESTSLTVDAEAIEALTVDVTGLQFIDRGDLELFVDGEETDFGDPVEFDEPYDGELTVTVETLGDELGEFAIEATFVTADDETSVTFRPTTVYASPIHVPEAIDDLQTAVDFVNPGDEVVVADGVYEVDEPDRGFQAGLYVGTPDITIRGEDGAEPVILHERDVPAPNVINVNADDVTLENLAANVVDGAADPKNEIGNGVRIDDGVSGATVRNVTTAGTSGVFLDADVSDVTVEGGRMLDAGIGVGTDLSGGPVADVTITGVTVENPTDLIGWGGIYLQNAADVTVTDCDITYGEDFNGGIVVDGDFTGSGESTIEDNEITGPDDDDPLADRDNGILVEDLAGTVANNSVVDAAVGVRVGDLGLGDSELHVTDNELDVSDTGIVQTGELTTYEDNRIDAEIGIDLDGGIFGLDADAVLARFNDLSATDVPFVGEPDDGFAAPDGPFDVRLNYLGDRTYDDTIADGDIAYSPFLTAPPEEVDRSEPTAIAVDLVLEPGGEYGLGTPGPTDRTIWELFGVAGPDEFAGTVEAWNQDDQVWQTVTGSGALQHVDTLSAFRIEPEEGVRAVVDFQYDESVPPGLRDDPDGTDLEPGWNAVAAPIYGTESEAFDADAIEEIDDDLEAPAGQLGEAEKNAFAGYKVSADADGWLDAGLDDYAPTMAELYEGLGLEPEIHDEPGAAGTATDAEATVEDVLEAAADDRRAVAGVARLAGHRFHETIDPDDDPDEIVGEIEAAATALAEEAPAGEGDVVEAGLERAIALLFVSQFGAVALPDEDHDARTTRIAADDDGSGTGVVGSLAAALWG
ncbi:S8 family serine peptidase [Natrononativus amylolyticus]|uniref:S8 family serine peptidase n=1 Tax=Natrononativus amylolyticus TaxID=2963434 RepID=UPI0020CB8392|nr:S8 family serine peptidase [Natrononativus amylolyticus]